VHLVEEAAHRLYVPLRVFILCGLVIRHTAEALHDVADPRAPTRIVVEARVAVRDNIETHALLIANEGRDLVKVLLAEEAIDHRGAQGPAGDFFGEPR
jgi:hypothetical protein